MDLRYPNKQEENKQFDFLFSKPQWTLSQAVFAVFDKIYTFQNIFENTHPLGTSFFYNALELEGSTPESKLYLKADRCIKTGVLKGKWIENENDYRVGRSDFVQWIALQEVDIGWRVSGVLELLTRTKIHSHKAKIQDEVKQLLHCFSEDNPPSREKLIEALRRGQFLAQNDKTLANYLSEIRGIPRRKRGRPKNTQPQKT